MAERHEPLLEAGRRLMDSHGEEDAALFAAALERTQDPAEIAALLEADATDDLPIAEKTAAYEKLLELGPRTAQVLRGFAQHLWLHGPQDDELVAALRAEADGIESAGR
jgi:hypothetical protein